MSDQNHSAAPNQAAPQPGPFEYAAAGFRILPINSDGTKRPLASGFGKDNPDAWCPPEQFEPGDFCAILTGPCPALAPDALLVLDVDGGTTFADVDAFTGVPLPPTLSSKGDCHRYYRVPPSEYRDALGAWARVFGRGTGAPALDLKYHGGYAIEPAGAWDVPFNVDTIAALPEPWLRRVFELRNQRPRGSSDASSRVAQRPASPVPLGDVDALIAALGAAWPQPGQGCHAAALALGGILADAYLDEVGIAQLANMIFAAAGTKSRTTDVLDSVDARMNGVPCKGWPSLKEIMQNADRGDWKKALDMLKNEIPGLRAPKVDLTALGVHAGTTAADNAPRAPVRALAIGSHAEVARKVIREHLLGSVVDAGAIWKRNTAGLWVEVPADKLARLVAAWDGATFTDPEGKSRLYRAVAEPVIKWIHTFRSRPGFFSAAPRGVAFRNGFLDIRTRRLVPLRRCRQRWALAFDYVPDQAKKAKPTNWIAFLRSIWGNDVQSIELVHQLLGYLLSGRMDLEKIFVLIGPPRAGKGTLFKLIGKIFGAACGAFSVNKLDNPFGMACMLGKLVSIHPDLQRGTSKFKNEGAIVEALKSISSGDMITIPVKYKDDVQTALLTRLLIGTNPPFELQDVTGVLTTRLVMLEFPRSFLGCEDTGLGARLEAEIPAIVDLALGGLDRLERAGRFVEPASAAETRRKAERAQNPMLGFVDELCELGADFEVPCADLYAAAVKWREANGHGKMASQTFANFLDVQGIRQVRTKRAGERSRVYRGIRLVPVGAQVFQFQRAALGELGATA
ncbi:MAG TPA: phage/plasmid primase, P4 family [Polyangiaceae bacterium]|nr:phage/plasmid primase, P4 family [Polyangiaceae bacterium]